MTMDDYERGQVDMRERCAARCDWEANDVQCLDGVGMKGSSEIARRCANAIRALPPQPATAPASSRLAYLRARLAEQAIYWEQRSASAFGDAYGECAQQLRALLADEDGGEGAG